MEKGYIKICPKCGSTKIQKPITITAAYGAPQNNLCNNCNHESQFFPEVEKKDIDKFRKDLLKK